MIIQIIKILLPIITSLMVGVLCKKTNIFDDNTNAGVRALLNNVILPIVLFNSFCFADYSKKSFIYIASAIIGMGAAYVAAIFLKRFFIKDYRDYFPEHVTTWEGGTLGISLATLLLGTYGTQHMALFDFGHAILFFGLIIPMLSIKDGEKANAKQIFKIIFSAKTFDFAMLGALCGILGFAKFINGNEYVSVAYHGVVDIITSSATFLILISVGYSININKNLLTPVFSACVCRLLLMSFGCLISYIFITRFMMMEKNIFVILLIGYSLPPSFALQIFTNFRHQKYMYEFSSVFTSVTTLITIVLFAAISIYAQI